MKYTIDINERNPKGKLVLSLLKELGVDAEKKVSKTLKPLTSKDVAFGIKRKATSVELKDYIGRVEESESIDINKLMKAYQK